MVNIRCFARVSHIPSLQVRHGPKDGRPGRREHHRFGAAERKGTCGHRGRVGGRGAKFMGISMGISMAS